MFVTCHSLIGTGFTSINEESTCHQDILVTFATKPFPGDLVSKCTKRLVDNSLRLVDNSLRLVDNSLRLVDNSLRLVDNSQGHVDNSLRLVDNSLRLWIIHWDL